MDKALKTTERIIVVLSPNFLASRFTPAEWSAAFARDPTGEKRLLIPVRVAACQPDGLLSQIIYVDLADGCDEAAAKSKLLEGLQPQGEPKTPPIFPRLPNVRSKPRKGARKPLKPPRFPGPIFSVGPLSIQISILAVHSNVVPPMDPKMPSIGRDTSGAECVVEIFNASTIPVDVQGEVVIAVGLLSFPNGGAKWQFLLTAIPPLEPSRRIPVQTRATVALSSLSGQGMEVITCSRVCYRTHGLPHWTPWHFPTRGNSAQVKVTL